MNKNNKIFSIMQIKENKRSKIHYILTSFVKKAQKKGLTFLRKRLK